MAREIKSRLKQQQASKNDNGLGLNARGFIDEEHKIIMFWTPRAACTVAIKMMFRHTSQLKQATEYKVRLVNPVEEVIHKYLSNVHARKTGLVSSQHLSPEAGYTKFKVVRNPYPRAVSSFNFIKIWFPNDKVLQGFSFEDYLRVLLRNNGKFVVNGKEIKIITGHSRCQYVREKRAMWTTT